MNTRSSSYTGRAARTLNEAFGPHQDYITDYDEQRSKPEELAIAFILALVLFCVALIAYLQIGGGL